MDIIRQENRGSIKAPPPQAKRILRGCLWLLAAGLLLLFALWWYVSRNADRLLKERVIHMADQSLNGSLDFSSIKMDLLGHAAFQDVAITITGETEPVVRAPEARVSLDFFNLLGPNRGQRALVMVLDKPFVTLVRQRDGSTNLERLIREFPEDQQPEQMGLSLQINQGTIDFEDRCLVSSDYPHMDIEDGLAKDLLRELDYDILAPAETAAHREQMKINGSVVLNTGRAELKFNLSVQRSGTGGQLTASGQSATQSGALDMRLQASDLDIASLAAYGKALFPKLTILPALSQASAPSQQPAVSALIRHLDLRMSRDSEADKFSQKLSAELASVHLDTATLPMMQLDGARFEFDDRTDTLSVSKLDLTALGSSVTGTAQFGPKSQKLGGRLVIDISDLNALLKGLDYEGPPAAGNLRLDLRPSGTLDSLQLAATVNGSKLAYDGHALGKVTGRLEYAADELLLDGLKFSGGDLPLQLDGTLNSATHDASLSFKLAKSDIGKLLDLAKDKLPQELQDLQASGSLAIDGKADIKAGKPESVDANLAGSKVEIRGVKLGTVNGGIGMAGDQLTFRELKLSGGALPLTINGSLDSVRGDAALSFRLGKTGLKSLLDLAGGNLPEDVGKLDAQGTLSADGALSMKNRKLSSASGTLNGNELVVSGVKLGTVSAKLSTADGRLKVESASFSGGEVPLTLSGSSDLAFENGSFSIEAGPLAVDKAARLAGRFMDKPLDTQGVTGKLKASGKLGFVKGKPTSSLTLTSDKLEKDGYSLQQLSVKGSLKDSSFELDVATGTFVTKAAVKLGSFSSTEPLRIPLRVGGSVSSTGKDGAVSLIGSGRTENLLPEQAELSFKLLGPLTAPQLRLLLKTEQDNEPLTLNADAYLAGGMQPAAAKLTWYDSQLYYQGKLDAKAQKFEGQLSASQISLDRFIDDKHIRGEFSLDGNLSGSFTEPTLSGRLRSPKLSYLAEQRRYDVKALDIGFKLKDGNAISVSNGSFSFEDQPFTVDGVLGAGGSDLTIACRNFNLLSALSMVPTSTANAGGVTKSTSSPIKVVSSGPLTAKLSGSLQKPSALVTYSSGPGQVEGNAFDSARLRLSATKDAAVLESFEIISPHGRATAQGGANFEPFHFNASAEITSFDVRLLTALAGDTALGGLSGQLNGNLRASGGTESYSADGDLSLAQGRFGEVDITELAASFRTHPDGIELTGARLTASGTTLTASGIIAHELNGSTINANAAKLDLALFNPLLPKDFGKLSGQVSLKAGLTPSKGKYPDLELNVQDLGGGLTLAGRHVDKAHATLKLKGDQATLSPLTLEVGNSSLEVTGKLDLREISPNSRRIPLNLKVAANSFQLDDIAGFMPKDLVAQMPGGNVTCNLDVRGNSLSPILSGELAVNLLRLPPSMPLELAELRAQFSLKNNDFSIRSMDLVPRASGYFNTRVTGSAHLAFNPPRITDGTLSLVFSDGGNHSRISVRLPNAHGDIERVFEGTLGGSIQIRTGQDLYHPDDAGTQLYVISGNPVINGGSGGSIFTFSPTPEAENKGDKIPFRFDDLTLMILEGSSFRTGATLMEMDSSIHTEPPGLVINGIPNALLAQDQLSIKGTIIIDKGTLRAYTHTLRMDESGRTRLHFTGMTTSAGLYPFFSGRASTVLKNALRGETTQQVGLTQSNTDLRVFFDFDNVQLNPSMDMMGNSEGLMNKVRLSSEPPRSPNDIKVYLLGGVGTLLSGDADISDVAAQELLGLGSNFLSGQLEKGLDLDSVTIGGSGAIDNPFHVGAEKDINDRLRVGYFRNFYDSLGSSEEVSFTYKLFEQQVGSRYKGLNLQLNVQDDALRGSGSEVMLQYTFSF